jgi:alkylation response protein AidB-like acyl-CoA dehydrogenase
MVNASTFNTYYDDVRVGDDAVIAGVNRGWDLIVNQLNYERVSLAPPGMLSRTYEQTIRWAQETKLADGRRVIDQEWVQINLATVRAKLEYLQLIGWKVASSGGASPADASSTKVFGTELSCEAYQLLSEVIGPAASLRKDSPGAVLAGRIERAMQGALILTFGGGVNEVQRDLIALFGLGLPRIPRH